ncbi:MAG: hypothetical protein MZV64_48690 [Ignavibacteriales bacterium]|nr:hypothetical protein [Ignavibacteriales bacterium]
MRGDAGTARAQAVAASHRIQHDLRPPVLDAGLAAALDWLARGFRRAHRPRGRRSESNREECRGRGPTAPPRCTASRRKPLTNVGRKHAQARPRARCSCSPPTDEVTLEIADDGARLRHRACSTPRPDSACAD